MWKIGVVGMNEQELYEYLLNTLQPSYERKFGTERRKNLMNISSLVSGKASYLYHWKQRTSTERETAPDKLKLNLALLRGAAFHAYVNQSLKDFDQHEIKWNISYTWKDPNFKDIVLIGHYDNLLPVTDKVLCEWKSTVQENINKNGLLLRAKRQLGTYARILKLKTGIDYEPFIVVFNTDAHIVKISPEEILSGFEYVRKTALEV